MTNMTLREFYGRTRLHARLALFCATLGLLFNVASYSTLSMRVAQEVLSLLVIAMMALGFALFVRFGRERTVYPEYVASPFPPALYWALLLALVYVPIVFFGMDSAFSPAGGPRLQESQEQLILGDSVRRSLRLTSVEREATFVVRLFSAVIVLFSLASP